MAEKRQNGSQVTSKQVILCLQGTSLDDPSRSYRTQLAVKAGGEMQEPVVVSTLPVTPETASIQIVTSQAKGSMIHSESFPSVAKSAGDQVCLIFASPNWACASKICYGYKGNWCF